MFFRGYVKTFQSTPSAWRETVHIDLYACSVRYFNPLPPHGGRPYNLCPRGNLLYFNPLPPHGGRLCPDLPPSLHADFNPLPPHGGRRRSCRDVLFLVVISIHSLRMEGDFPVHSGMQRTRNNFNPLPPHGGRPRWSGGIHQRDGISIHSLRMEGDGKITLSTSTWADFNPLPPHGGRHPLPESLFQIGGISIHSLRMEGDSKTAQESVFHFAYPCTILQKRMQKTTFCTRKNGFFRKKGEKFGAKPSASFCAPMIRTDTFPLNFSHRISGSSMSMVSFAPICSTFD